MKRQMALGALLLTLVITGGLLIGPAQAVKALISGSAGTSELVEQTGGDARLLNLAKPAARFMEVQDACDAFGEAALLVERQKADAEYAEALVRGTPADQARAEKNRDHVYALLKGYSQNLR